MRDPIGFVGPKAASQHLQHNGEESRLFGNGGLDRCGGLWRAPLQITVNKQDACHHQRKHAEG